MNIKIISSAMLAAGLLAAGTACTTVAVPAAATHPVITKTAAPAPARTIIKKTIIRKTIIRVVPAPAPAPVVTDPWAVVGAFYADITSKDYAGAWQLLGFDPSGGYAAFVAGYADTGGQSVTENWESGDQVSFDLMSTNPDGSVQYYTGIDTVINGKIASASVKQTG
jgi:hypothetical protein